jgi:hypothetical protein
MHQSRRRPVCSLPSASPRAAHVDNSYVDCPYRFQGHQYSKIVVMSVACTLTIRHQHSARHLGLRLL